MRSAAAIAELVWKMKRLLSYNADFGISTWHELNAVTKQTEITYTYDDVDHILDDNQRRQNNGTDGYNADRTWKHVAAIPMSLIQKWLIEDGFDFFAKDHTSQLKKLLNDPDWRKLRTGLGRL